MHKHKSGFTLVELCIVMAVIAILAVVYVPSFAGISYSSTIKSDILLVDEYNRLLSADFTRHDTMYDALQVLDDADYTDPFSTSSELSLGWDSQNDCFLLVDPEKGILYSPSELQGFTEINISDAERHLYFIPCNSVEESHGFSIYAIGTWSGTISIPQNVGFDAGENQGLSLNVTEPPEGTSNAETAELLFRTNGGSLTVSSEQTSIRHYGSCEQVTLENCLVYTEYDSTTFINLSVGTLYLKENADVKIVTFRTLQTEENAPADTPQVFGETAVLSEASTLPTFTYGSYTANGKVVLNKDTLVTTIKTADGEGNFSDVAYIFMKPNFEVFVSSDIDGKQVLVSDFPEPTLTHAVFDGLNKPRTVDIISDTPSLLEKVTALNTTEQNNPIWILTDNEYTLSKPITLKKSVSICGNNATFKTGDGFTDNALIVLSSANNTVPTYSFSNLSFDLSSAFPTEESLSLCAVQNTDGNRIDLSLRHCNFAAFKGGALSLTNTSAEISVEDCSFQTSKLSDASPAISLSGAAGYGIRGEIKDCHFSGDKIDFAGNAISISGNVGNAENAENAGLILSACHFDGFQTAVDVNQRTEPSPALLKTSLNLMRNCACTVCYHQNYQDEMLNDSGILSEGYDSAEYILDGNVPMLCYQKTTNTILYRIYQEPEKDCTINDTPYSFPAFLALGIQNYTEPECELHLTSDVVLKCNISVSYNGTLCIITQKSTATTTEEISTGETPTGETAIEETPAGETSTGETTTAETPAGETPTGETTTAETPAGETPTGETTTEGTPEYYTVSGGENNYRITLSSGCIIETDSSALITLFDGVTEQTYNEESGLYCFTFHEPSPQEP